MFQIANLWTSLLSSLRHVHAKALPSDSAALCRQNPQLFLVVEGPGHHSGQ